MTNRGPSIVMGSVQWGPNRYPTLWVWEEGQYWAFPLHRLTAYAHGELDHPRFEPDGVIAIDDEALERGEVLADHDPREVHHRDEDKLNGRPENLEALEPRAHALVTNGSTAD